MVVEQRIGCEFVGLSTDAKPENNTGLTDFRFYESDKGNIYYYGGASWQPIIGASAAVSYQNKTISATDNDFENSVAADFPLSFLYHRSGSLIPAVAGPYLVGALGGMSVTVGSGENAVSGLDSAEGHYQNFKGNLTGEKMGVQSTSSTNSMITSRGQNPYLAVRCKIDQTSGVRLYIGFTSNQTLPASNTPLGSADSGVILGFGSASTSFMSYVNDGLQAAATQAFSSVKDNDWHTYEITMTVTTITCTMDGTDTILMATQLPNTATSLYFNCVAQYV